jgi:hypothetical protein
MLALNILYIREFIAALYIFVCRWKLSGQVDVNAAAEVPFWARRRFPGVVCSYAEL